MMKKYVIGYMSTILLGSSIFAPGLYAAGEQTLDSFATDTLQQIVQNSMQQMIEDSMHQLMQDSIRLQRSQPRMHIRLTDDTPVGLEEHIKEDATGNLPLEHELPQTTIPASRGKLG